VGQLVHIVREDPFYRYNLKEADHDHFITEEGAKEPIIVAIDAEPARLDTSTKAYRAIVRTPRGDYRVVVRCERKKDRIAALRKAFPQLVPANARLRLVKSLAIRDVMVEFDEKNYKDKFKFGVVFARAGQTAESQMFQNEHGSPGLETFLNLIAERVELATHTGYHGGLKAYPGHSYYTKFHGTEIMLHVSTLLPYKQGDPQQIERKRQIGNDVVIIVYRDEASGKDQIEPHSVLPSPPLPLLPFSSCVPSCVTRAAVHVALQPRVRGGEAGGGRAAVPAERLLEGGRAPASAAPAPRRPRRPR
jgi:hypothetical protein